MKIAKVEQIEFLESKNAFRLLQNIFQTLFEFWRNFLARAVMRQKKTKESSLRKL
jgi:hypothetical protein